MLCFTIPLRSKNSTSDFVSVIKNFEKTLDSIYNQTSGEFRVYVGCTEVPTLSKKYDERLIFVPNNVPTPTTWIEKCRDRAWKLTACANKIYNDLEFIAFNDGGVFVFPVDADDYINKNIVEYVNRHNDANGFKSKTGYRWVKGETFLTISPYFGGTMNIMKMYESDLPHKMPDSSLSLDMNTAKQLNELYPIRWTDIECADMFKSMGREFSELPFRSTVYVTGTGVNISVDDPREQKKKERFHPIAFLRSINPLNKRFLSAKIKSDFGI